MTKCGQSGIKIVYNHTNYDYVTAGVEKCNLWEYIIRFFGLIIPSHNKVVFF